MEDLPDMDLGPFLAEHRAQDLFSVQLYYGLHPRAEISPQWGTPAQNWNRQPIRYDDPHGKEIAARRVLPDTLQGLQAPLGVPCWFRIISGRGMTLLPVR